MKNLKRTVLILFVASAFISCEGPQGLPGPSGNANVTIWKTDISNLNWIDDGGDGYRYSINCPIITDSVIDGNYQVLASVEISQTAWVNLPFISAGTDFTESCQFLYSSATPNSILYAYSDDDETTLNDDITELKVAVIQGFSGKKEWSINEIENNPHLFNIKYIVN